ncbi:MAG TPA: ECF-type sigma factor [Planctomycetota bacterium]|nr:ECF-type sigma factor [Planctomycetota bacterium]
MTPQDQDVTGLLAAWSEGDQVARDAVVALVYAELRRIAKNRMRREGDAVTLQTTGLVHEAYLRLARQNAQWQNRAHFFAIAARVMRRVLVEGYRGRHAQKRGGLRARVALEEVDAAATPASLDLEALNGALDGLERQDRLQAHIVELRYFAGLTIEETAEAVHLSPATVKREWALARAWLKREMCREH